MSVCVDEYNIIDKLCEMRNLLESVLYSGIGWRECESQSPSSRGGGLVVRCKYCHANRPADAKPLQHGPDCLIHSIRKAIEGSRGI